MGSFGDKFRKERERREFTLDDVSNVTKISSRMLKAIEDEHFDQLPGGVFNKGFIRAYAKHLGLNDEEAVNEYLAALRQAQVDAQSAGWQPEHPPLPRTPVAKFAQPVPVPPFAATRSPAPPPAAPPPTVAAEPPRSPVPAQEPLAEKVTRRPPASEFKGETAGPRRSIPWRIPAVVVALIVITVFLWNRHSRNARAYSAPAHQSVSSGVSAQATVPPPPAISTQPVAPPNKLPATPIVAASTPSSNPASNAASVAPKSAESTPGTPKNSAGSDVTVKKFSRAATPAGTSVPVAKPFTLQIRAAENSWISVTADGQLITQETLIAPANTSVRGTREIVVKAGNAAGVSFLINGKEIPAQGTEGEVKTYIFDPNGLRLGEPSTSDPH
ncbi:MAG TPA: RodZ domain-containing protein [Candidatus Sulfotelmatobacter sp.]|nr:RodZ domain-containing protein [Candidatus Sulfotelmatobacter sp.]